MDFIMYRLVCFILLVSLSTTTLAQTNTSESTVSTNVTSSNDFEGPLSLTQNTMADLPKSPKTNSITTPKTMKNTEGKPMKSEPNKKGCLINLYDQKDLLLLLIISFLCLICLLLLMIIMCMACNCCRGMRNNEVVMLKSSTIVRRNSANGGPCETDVLLKDCSSVKVEMETTPAEKPEEVGGADAEEDENQDSTEENKNSANDTSETAPTQEADQSAQTDLKMEASENAE